MKPFRILTLCALLLLSVLSACSNAARQELSGPEPVASSSGKISTPSPAPPQAPMPEQIPVKSTIAVPSEITEKARQDLAHRLGISPDSITVFAVIGQEFSIDVFYCRATKERIAREDSSQVLSGLSILLSAAGRRYEYHASDQAVIFCRPLS